ncbi:hypothetical protein TBLA_0G02800 [Henningerozyma blattae CBS 6284]|uniref:Galactokinase n=1 Tax=Henningerozyma blattae (strain ATCC 34711 / CBS 6284 / DSM 70876 / NBRC 10599 / NRRL Y-10934 / UCD 77-7) TaxID=1071380 RepID=I2H766_HENB6|nr:hypothetical protein TBLA_0G02800 [Tetrapisispora blattae CBS 6284]CCH62218.1 hypothetical protein TBLA_0G02800 [Tetrapisispora blattae CBS 6284]
MSVPVYHAQDSNELSSLSSKLIESCQKVVDKFTSIYGCKPDFIARSPGRVNLIGEHIDYVDFSVLPMAIDPSMLVAIKILKYDEDEDEDKENSKTNSNESLTSNPSILLTNDDHKFAQRKFDLPLDGSYITIDPSVSDWSNYFKCGFYVAHEYLKKKFPERFNNKPLYGLKVFCKSDVPSGSGLSSSAAFTCAVAMAIIRANTGKDYRISKHDLTEICVIAEHYVGVNNGGMDQAASIFGELDHALYVEFKPKLKATPIKFPTFKNSNATKDGSDTTEKKIGNELTFLIANSLVVSNKYETAPTNYNLRVVEVTIAASVLANFFQIRLPNKITDNGMDKGNLRDFMDAYYARYYNEHVPWNGDLKEGISRLTKMLELVEECFNTDEKRIGYTVNDISNALDCSREEFTRDFLMVFPIRFQLLKLYQRSKHVFSESLRVLKTLELMINTNNNLKNNQVKGNEEEEEEKFCQEFGELMNQSQASCDKLYECSSNELNDLCKIALANGSYGSRLTGAGWGGCTIHLLPNDTKKIEKVRKALIEEFYKVRYPQINEEELENATIVSRPARGSFLYEV